MIKLRLCVRKLEDGRFRVRYQWFHWYSLALEDHKEYFKTEAEAAAFVSDLVTKTRWND
jgi:hypothetical protein